MVAADFADTGEFRAAYAIGVAKPLTIKVNTYAIDSTEDSDLRKIRRMGTFSIFVSPPSPKI